MLAQLHLSAAFQAQFPPYPHHTTGITTGQYVLQHNRGLAPFSLHTDAFKHFLSFGDLEMNHRFTLSSSCWAVFRIVFLFLELFLQKVSLSCPARTSFSFPLEPFLECGLADVSLLFFHVEGFLALILRWPFLLLGFRVFHGLVFPSGFMFSVFSPRQTS
jgi:hypothetical protein